MDTQEPLLNSDGQAVHVTVDDGGADSPFAPNSPAAPSPAPSAPAGAPAEPAAPSAEAAPAPTPSPAAQPPAPQAPAEPAAPAAPAEPATPAEPAAPAAPDPTVLEGLVQWRGEAVTEAQRAAQSKYDRRAAEGEKKIEELTQVTTDLRNQMRDASIADLTPEEQAEARQKWVLEDKSGVLDAREAELAVYHKFLLVESYIMEFGDFGATEEGLQAFETPAEMQAYCFERKAEFFEQKVNAAPAASAEAPAAAAAAPATPPQPAVPAAASAPVDIATGGGAQPDPTPNTGKGPAALREALAGTKVETIR